MQRHVIGLAMLGGLAAGAAMAEPMDGRSAKKMLYSPRGGQIEVLAQDFLTEADVKTLRTLAKVDGFKTLYYYGAIAASPRDGVLHESIHAAIDHHSVEAAGKQAVAGCNAKRTGGAKCVVVALIRPKKWTEDRPLQLSATATEAFRKVYSRGRGPKAMAISPGTGKYGIGKGDGAVDAALSACSKDADDCEIVIQD